MYLTQSSSHLLFVKKVLPTSTMECNNEENENTESIGGFRHNMGEELSDDNDADMESSDADKDSSDSYQMLDLLIEALD